MDVATPKELFLDEYHPNKVLHRMWGGGGGGGGGGWRERKGGEGAGSKV